MTQARTAAAPDGQADPVTFELVKNALFFLVNEMALTLVRASYSGILRENMDFSTGIANRDGEMISQGLSLPLQFGPMPDAVAAVRRAWQDRMEPGDVFVLNDPFEGGTHLPDFFFVNPVFHDGAIFCYTCVAGHQVDVGGRVAGSNACDSTEVYAEGLRVPPLKLYERGVPNETLFNIIERNVRVPVKLLGDFRAQVAKPGDRRERHPRAHHALWRWRSRGVLRGAFGLWGAADPRGHRRAARRRISFHRLPRFRRHRAPAGADRAEADDRRRSHHRRLHRQLASGPGRDQLDR